MGRPIEAATLRHGIDIWEGLPGSGKSYGAVDVLTKAILWKRRPVYTNLPLRLRVLRKYLVKKTGDAMAARYVQKIDRDHFYRFVKRNEVFSELKDQKEALGWSRGEIEREFERLHGPNIVKGRDAQWFHPGSVFILDEFHRWADQRVQKDEDPAFRTYATMHRHHLHWILLLTQNRMQISYTWRRNMATLVHCADKRRLPFMFGFKLPLAAFAYEEYPGELVIDARDLSQVQPTDVLTRIPAFEGGRIFRFYDSYTHMGGARRLQMKLNSVREQIEGTQLRKDEGMSQSRPRRGWMGYLVTAAAVAITTTAVMYGCSESKPPKPVERPNMEKAVEFNPGADFVAKLKNKPREKPEIEGRRMPLVTIVGRGYVIADGRMVSVGKEANGYQLLGISAEDGETLWGIDDRRIAVPLGVLVDDRGEQSPGADGEGGTHGVTTGHSLREKLERAGIPTTRSAPTRSEQDQENRPRYTGSHGSSGDGPSVRRRDGDSR